MEVCKYVGKYKLSNYKLVYQESDFEYIHIKINKEGGNLKTGKAQSNHHAYVLM